VIESTIIGKTLHLQVDSGFDGLLVFRSRLNTRSAFARSESYLANIAQTLVARTFDLTGGADRRLRSHHPQVSVVDGAPAESAGFDGLIGTAFLSKGRVAFDFDNKIVYWE
jgi:hypothetical protein